MGRFNLRLTNSTGNADIAVGLNPAGKNFPVVGDWTGQGYDAVGVFNQNTGNFALCTSNSTANCALPANQIALTFGVANDTPLSGRWMLNATHAGVGVYRPSNGLLYVKNILSTGFADHAMVLGIPGDQGVAGDWTGRGFDSVGVYRPAGITFYLSNQITDGPINGDISFQFGASTDVAITGDWIGQGHDGVGTFRPTTGNIFLKNQLTTGNADNAFVYGAAGDQPVAGYWQNNSANTATVTPQATCAIGNPFCGTSTPTVTPQPTCPVAICDSSYPLIPKTAIPELTANGGGVGSGNGVGG